MKLIQKLKTKIFKKEVPSNKPSGVKLGFEFRGHKFYVYDPIHQAPTGRIEEMFARLDSLQKGMTREHLIEYANLTKQLFWEQKHEEGHELSTHVVNIVNNPMQNNPANYLSSIMVLIDDEPTDELNSHYEELKLRLIKEHKEVRNFFLGITDKILAKYMNSHDSQEFWKAVNHPALQKNEQAFLKFLSRYRSIDTGSNEKRNIKK